MSRILTDDDIEAICARLTQFSGLTPEEHREHHTAFAAYIEAQRRRAEFRDKLQQQIGGWLVVTFLAGIGYAAWNGFLSFIGKAS
jgi:hypothetical protein